ncbi:hypothetical protein [Salinimicrobium sediminilitoris]|uniref:hypothetical protein n=1 Tax=Salinimicrobium sediminilitoris TaxID=2876715 RepID=UPI001E5F9A56|nr:hypothetical protein [Salinimicrobium sediminilitoris]MCC8360690.1 hypothetical protein [Salinimicrobium sediminilitoris]
MRKKPTIQILPVFLVLCLSFGTFSCNESKTQGDPEQVASGEMSLLQNSSEDILAMNSEILPVEATKDTNVLLTVDTENITEETVEEFVKISDDRSGSSEGVLPSDHVALVEKNMKIFWSAEALDPQLETTVDVLGIFRKPEGGAEILDGVFRDPNKDGIVMGKIKNKKVNGLEYYNIMIRINEETPRTFVIDPKLQMKHD